MYRWITWQPKCLPRGWQYRRDCNGSGIIRNVWDGSGNPAGYVMLPDACHYSPGLRSYLDNGTKQDDFLGRYRDHETACRAIVEAWIERAEKQQARG
jgi:hypothetical protein